MTLAPLACSSDNSGDAGATGDADGDAGDGDADTGSDAETGDGDGGGGAPKAVDILFVVDDSWTMGEEQGGVARALPAFIDVLESDDANIDYRIAVTTTTNGHKGCNTKPGIGGVLVMDSCLGQPDSFTDPGRQISRFNTGCKSVCDHESIAVKSTAVAGDSEKKARPWFEGGSLGSNLEGDVKLVDALACVLPRGISGCGYEAQIESTLRVLERSKDKEDESYGFIRDDAHLAIVYITDEADCSYNHEGMGVSAAFESTNNTFWANPNVGPTSSICWNAGVRCTGEDGGVYENCVATDMGTDGKETEEGPAVLFPMQRYYDALDKLLDRKRDRNPRAEIYIGGMVGVDEDGKPHYSKTPDTNHFDQFGVDPGCLGSFDVLEEVDPQSEDTTVPAQNDIVSYAVPPVRLLGLVDWSQENSRFDDDQRLYSICESDAKPQLKALAQQIVGLTE